MRIVYNTGTRKDASDTSDGPGIIEILNEPPNYLESPHYNQDALDEDVMIIDTESNDPRHWSGCRVFWRGKYWKVAVSIGIQNGQRALLELISDPQT